MTLAKVRNSKLAGHKNCALSRSCARDKIKSPVLIIVLVVLFCDQFSKVIIINKLSLHQSLPLIKGIFHLTLVYNRGAAFGILKNQIPLFIVTSLVAIILIYLNYKRNKQKKSFSYNLSLALILAGALGNLIDRLFFGYVIDFFDFRIWPVFNIADSAITVGAFLLAYSMLRLDKKRIRPQ
jgi:signal peptidase II